MKLRSGVSFICANKNSSCIADIQDVCELYRYVTQTLVVPYNQIKPLSYSQDSY